jgi:predicted glycosyltransferase
MKRLRVLFYVQHLLGIGHFRRAATIARAMSESGLAVAFVSGGEPIAGIDLGDVELIQLSPAVAGDVGFSTIVDADGRPIDNAWRTHRRAELLDSFKRTRPHLLLIELYPFGRRAFRFELLPLLEAATGLRQRPAIACSLRDILVAGRDIERQREAVRTARRYFDRVLVHSDPSVVRLEGSFPAAGDISDLLHYTGYVVNPPGSEPASRAGEDEVLVSAGGGAVGAPLLEAALQARSRTRLAGATWRLITGINVPERAVAALRAAAPAGVVVERFRPDFLQLLRNCRISVSQAGYNTVMEILAAGTRAVVVPFAAGQETEQTMRARLLHGRGLVGLVEASALSPAALAAAIDETLARRPPGASDIALGGARTTAKVVATLAEAAAQGRLTGSPHLEEARPA